MIFNGLTELCEELRAYRITHFIDAVPTLSLWPDGDIELISQHFEENSIPAGRFEGRALYFDFPQGTLPADLADALEEQQDVFNGVFNEIGTRWVSDVEAVELTLRGEELVEQLGTIFHKRQWRRVRRDDPNDFFANHEAVIVGASSVAAAQALAVDLSSDGDPIADDDDPGSYVVIDGGAARDYASTRWQKAQADAEIMA